MAKRKAIRSTTGTSKRPVTTANGNFEIPPLLKTEPIYVEPAIYDTPCPVFKMQIIPGVGSCLLGSGYKLVKTTVSVEVGTQTGCDEITVDPLKMEVTDPFYYDSVPSTSINSSLVGELRRNYHSNFFSMHSRYSSDKF